MTCDINWTIFFLKDTIRLVKHQYISNTERLLKLNLQKTLSIMSIYNYVDLNCKKMVHVKIIITWIYLINNGIINMFFIDYKTTTDHV